MTPPIVTILLPCLNNRAFLETRIRSLLDQTFTDWEGIVLDSYSDDGSWELFQSVAADDARFRLYRIPREGLYAALNRGLTLARGELLHIATCDDTMQCRFLEVLIDALRTCTEAGLAVSDLALINRAGDPLRAEDMAGYLPAAAIEELLSLDVVRSYLQQEEWNYRPPPHDCLMHFSAKSVYLSLTQLVIKTSVARENGPFDLSLGRIADLAWLVRLTNWIGTVHVPLKLANWRFHGNQSSIGNDTSHLDALRQILEDAAKAVYRRHFPLLSANDSRALLLPCKRYLAQSPDERAALRREFLFRVARMILERPSTIGAMRRARFRVSDPDTLIPMFMERLGYAPRRITSVERERRGAAVCASAPLPSSRLNQAMGN